MKDLTLSALEACGRERVFDNPVQQKVAIRWEQPRYPHEWVVGEGADVDASGLDAAEKFAARLREFGTALIKQADEIGRALKKARAA